MLVKCRELPCTTLNAVMLKEFSSTTNPCPPSSKVTKVVSSIVAMDVK
jgi:hypothetical protein